ncbi:nucleotidyl transferase AbiEii/AbiGii toxin family protein [Polymorphospora sp. NPDC050346]|uniref:nucleotidyl transferase AbiEii/AbiGii toxin family protein n=1 Tax=Polymorphospora sp. NPDC050346 TaxID=3155780 RepID=UPI0033CE9C16
MTAAPSLDPIFADVARIALGVARRHGFALGGGLALVLHGVVHRPTEDIDLFSDIDAPVGAARDEVRAALEAAGFDVRAEEPDSELGDLFHGFDHDLADLVVGREGRELRLTLGRLDRHRAPVVMDLGPVMHIDDLVAGKIAALVNRREVRDYIDAAAALQRYDLGELLALGHRADPALDPEDVVRVGAHLDAMDDRLFGRYGLTPPAIAELRAKLADWPRPGDAA